MTDPMSATASGAALPAEALPAPTMAHARDEQQPIAEQVADPLTGSAVETCNGGNAPGRPGAESQVMTWLLNRAPGFDLLSNEERTAIADFSLLWPLFEARILRTQGSASEICRAVAAWQEAGTLDPGAFATALAYFQDRYFAGGDVTGYWHGLHFKNNDRAPMVRAVLDGSDTDPVHVMAAILIIILRYRNNLFHGIKWHAQLQDQLGNFTTANRVLMQVLESQGALQG